MGIVKSAIGFAETSVANGVLSARNGNRNGNGNGNGVHALNGGTYSTQSMIETEYTKTEVLEESDLFRSTSSLMSDATVA